MGKYYTYYHCNKKEGCDERKRTETHHKALDILLEQLTPSLESIELFKEIIKDVITSKNSSKRTLLKTKKIELKQSKKKHVVLIDKLLNEVISDDDYTLMSNKLKDEKEILLDDIKNLEKDSNEIIRYISYGVTFLRNLKIAFQNGSIQIRQKVLSSILTEKLILDGMLYRTPKLNEGLNFILMNTNELGSAQNKNGRPSIESLPLCTDSVSFLELHYDDFKLLQNLNEMIEMEFSTDKALNNVFIRDNTEFNTLPHRT